MNGLVVRQVALVFSLTALLASGLGTCQLASAFEPTVAVPPEGVEYGRPSDVHAPAVIEYGPPSDVRGPEMIQYHPQTDVLAPGALQYDPRSDTRWGGTLEQSHQYHHRAGFGAARAGGWYHYGFPVSSFRWGWFGAEHYYPRVLWHKGYNDDCVRWAYRRGY